ncbi:MAG: cytochrome c oxidase subunit II [Alphaproteobacteria bacterium]|nr:cytochrome c oxidase subunit II [Alphaproteobacteria bacterium]MBV9419630.1 cytochrome c oxidase subunit II [Alphaproteobacteria bacterium]MBV9541287.1 cytochrome c oxidase subunit II [Alphaproteobacteria bacterium]MBV9905814.1 cytochrome c oxidase subunit II [Alphaproteobacteria bacterium]
MSLRKFGIGAVAVAGLMVFAGAALGAPHDYEMGLQPAASPVMERIESFHSLLLYIITAITLFVLALLVWIVIRYNRRSNPVPSKTHHNTLLEVAWTVIPVIILVIIAIPSFKLLYYEEDRPPADVKIRAIGKQWFWTYEYPQDGNFTFDSLGLTSVEAAAGTAPDASAAAGKPRLLGVDNPIYVPVNKVVEIETTGADVIHSWALQEMGVKMDAIPGRLNHTWFKATHTGVYYGQCSELCGAKHAFMPIEVHVVTDAEYAAWIATAKKKFAQIDNGNTTRLAAQ